MIGPWMLSVAPTGMDCPGAALGTSDQDLIQQVHQCMERMWAKPYLRKNDLDHNWNLQVRHAYARRGYSWLTIMGWALSRREATYSSPDRIYWAKLLTVWPNLPVGPRLWDLFDGPTTIPMSPRPTSLTRGERLKLLAATRNQHGGMAATSDHALMEGLTTMANEGTRAAARALILRITRAGFKQLRRVNEGYLFGSGTYRFMVPYSVVKQAASPSYIDELTRKFDEVRAARDADYGRPRPPDPSIDVVENPEDLLREEPTVNTEAERSDPAPATGAVEGSTPSGLPTTPPLDADSPVWPRQEETTTMPVKRRSDGKRYPNPWTCPKCGITFIQKGRHEGSCTGAKKAPKAKRIKALIEVSQTSNGRLTILEAYDAAFVAFTTAHANLMTHIHGLDGQVRTLERENKELQTFKQRASALFEPSSRVPRG